MVPVIKWYLAVSLLGILALPVSFWLLNRLPGRGLLFSRPLGILIAAYTLWLGASLGVLRNDTRGVLLALFALGGCSVFLLFSRSRRENFFQSLRRERSRLVVSELLFAGGLAAWAIVRAFTADKIIPSGGEKFMEIAFLNAVLNSPGFPPPDPWLSGFSISYYYFGYVQMGFLTRLSGLQAEVAFELYNAVLFALTLQLTFALVGEMAALSGLTKKVRHISGLAAALFAAGMGNLQGMLEALSARGWLPGSFTAWLDLPDFPSQLGTGESFYPGHASWWWWHASRVINDLDFTGQRIPANPITEFPFFSFLLGDNHPHVLALPFGLLAAALALDWANRGSLRGIYWPGWLPRLILSGLVLGGLIFLNTWDFPIYFGLALLAFLGSQFARQGRLVRADWVEALMRAVLLITVSALLVLPFLLSFSSQAGGILPYVFPPTRLAQYLVMFGLFVFILSVFLPAALAASNNGSALPFSWRRAGLWFLRSIAGLAVLFLAVIGLAGLVLVLDQLAGGVMAETTQSWLGGGSTGGKLLRILAARIHSPWLFLLLCGLLTLCAAVITAAPRQPKYNPAGLHPVPRPAGGSDGESEGGPDVGLVFAATLALTGLALTLTPEYFYLRDSFGVRMNTIFKFYFQAWILLACACGYAVGWMAQFARPAMRTGFLLGVGILSLAGLVYPVLSIMARTHEFTTPPVLDGTSNLRRDYPEDWAAIAWLRSQTQSAQQIPILLEAPGTAYSYAGRISAFTGFPTVLGWSSHEAQWRGSSAEQSRRLTDIATVYTSADAQEIRAVLDKYSVDYVIMGQVERETIAVLCAQSPNPCSPQNTIAIMNDLLIPVFHHGSTTVYAVPR